MQSPVYIQTYQRQFIQHLDMCFSCFVFLTAAYLLSSLIWIVIETIIKGSGLKVPDVTTSKTKFLSSNFIS